MPKENKMLAESKRVQAEANRLRDFYISRTAEGRERLMEMANAVNYDHYKMKAVDLAVTQLSAANTVRPRVVGVEGVRSKTADRSVPANEFNAYLDELWPKVDVFKATVNSPRWDIICKRPNKHLIIQLKESKT